MVSNATIASGLIRYTKDGTNYIDVLNCPAPGVTPAVVPAAGRPCIRIRKVYGISGVPA